MELKTSFVLAAILGIATSLFMIIAFFFHIERDSREPPFIPQTIPYIGHLIGIIRKGGSYYDQVSAKYPLAAYSLSMPGWRTYVINSPDLVVAVQRNPKLLMPEPFTAKYASKAFALSKEAETIWLENIDLAKGDWGLNYDAVKAIRHALTLGSKDLDQITQVTLHSMTVSFKKLTSGEAVNKVRLMEWLRSELMTAATSAIYGPMNPFQEKEVQNGFWDFVDNFAILLINIMPNKTAPKGCKGRERIFKAFEHYLRNGKPENESSGLFKAVYKIYKSYNVPTKDIAHFEMGNVVATTANTAPAIFWNLYHIYSDPALLNKIRAEAKTALSVTIDQVGSQRYALDVVKLRTACPLINSIFQEVLRFRAVNASFRLVIKDVMLQDRYLLKKDSVVFMPNRVIHHDTNIWGSNAQEFVADRFVQQPQKIHQGAYLAFGGGVALCPGKHLATWTSLAIVAMFALRYEARPVNNRWINPTVNKNNHLQIMPSPDQDILLNITPREGFENGSWEFLAVE